MKELNEMINLFEQPKDAYKMKSLKWYQRIKIFFSSWYDALKYLPQVIRYIRLKENG